MAVSQEQAIPNSPFTFARDGLSHDVNGLKLPIGCKALAVVAPLSSDIVLWTVTGTTTGAQYESILLQGFENFLYCRVHQQIDPVVNLHFVINAGAGNAVVGIVFIFSDTIVSLDTQTISPAFLLDGSGNVLASDTALSGLRRVGVSLKGADPALWQAPTNNLFGFQAGVGTTALLAGTGGQIVRLWDGVVDVLTAAAGAQFSVQDTAGNVLAQGGAADRKTFPCGFIARQVVTGNGVQLVVAGGAATVQFGAGYSKG